MKKLVSIGSIVLGLILIAGIAVTAYNAFKEGRNARETTGGSLPAAMTTAGPTQPGPDDQAATTSLSTAGTSSAAPATAPATTKAPTAAPTTTKAPTAAPTTTRPTTLPTTVATTTLIDTTSTATKKK